jgi:UDP-N-acetylglucosamine:LPS N-acetylglucosamine transferase
VTGNPVRPELLAAAERPDRDGARRRLGLPLDRRVVGVFSGSLGSRRINEATRGAVDVWADRSDLAVRHVVGRRDWEAYRRSIPEPSPGGLVYQALEYEHQMDLLLTSADLVVCRAGAMTLAEIAACGVPAILVPYPFAAYNHQEINAQNLAERGGAVSIRDAELTGERLSTELLRLGKDRETLIRMSANARRFARPDAAARIARSLIEWATDPAGKRAAREGTPAGDTLDEDEA